MAHFEKRIHDFTSLFGAQAWVSGGYNLTEDRGYVNFLKSINSSSLSGLNPFSSDGTATISSQAAVTTEVVNGVWNVVCSVCNSRTVVRKNKSLFICTTCYTNNSINAFYRINWRSDKEKVERVLLKRPDAINRNALQTETVNKLVQENRDNLRERQQSGSSVEDDVRGSSRGRR